MAELKDIGDRLADFILGCIIAAIFIANIWDIIRGEDDGNRSKAP